MRNAQDEERNISNKHFTDFDKNERLFKIIKKYSIVCK